MQRLFTKNLLQWKNATQRKPLVIQGLRQVGKTYSMDKFGAENFPKMHCLNFEQNDQLAKIFAQDLNPHRIINEIAFALDTPINIDQDLIFFDEIQACPRALTSLKYFQEQMPELALCSAGSLLGVHLNATSFPVGKVDFLKVFPMSFIEFLIAIEDTKSLDFLNTLTQQSKIPDVIHMHLWQQLKLYFIVGGLPEVVNTFKENKDNLYQALELVRIKQNTLITAYIADIAKHSGKINSMHIERVWKSVPAQLARAQENSALKFKFKGIIPGVNRYTQLISVIDWLEAAGLITKVGIVNSGELPFASYTKENTFKLYMADVGLLGALSGLPPKTILDYEYGTYKGYFAENFVAQEFLSAGVDKLYSWQKGRAEIEFLREVQGDVIPIEVKSGWVIKSKSLKTFAEKYHPPFTVTMSAKPLHIDNEHKIHKYPLYLASKFPLLF